MKRTRWLWLILVCLAAGGFLYWKSGKQPNSTVPSTSAQELPTVTAITAGRESLASTLTLTAEFVPFQEVEVMAKIAGYVQRINVDVGDYVKQGQVLAVIESPEMRDDLTRASVSIQRSRSDVQRAADEVKRADSTYAMTHLTYTRLANVSKAQPGLVAQQEVDDAQGKDHIAASQLAAAKSSLITAEEQIKLSEADQTKSRTMLDYTRVLAPFNGVVTKRYADNGSMIQAGTSSRSQAMPLVRISENYLLRLVLPVPESAAGLVKPGKTLQIKVPSLNATMPAQVSRIADKVDTATRTMRVEVDVPNGNARLIPGMYAEVTLNLAESPHALAIPMQGIKRLAGGQRQISIVTPTGTVEVRNVTTGLESATSIEILSGLREGESVIVGNHSQLNNGARVIVRLQGPGSR